MNRLPLLSSLALAASLACTAAWAQTPPPSAAEAIRTAAQKAISGNPELASRLNALRATTSAVAAARGGLYPRAAKAAGV